jgi:hypothetical protein
MRMDRRTTVPAAVLLACSAIFAVASWVSPAAAVRSGAPPFCVMRGGPRGPGSVPQICLFFDYQECLQAAADLNGNCVVNIDYHGEVSMPPAPAGTRHRR